MARKKRVKKKARRLMTFGFVSILLIIVIAIALFSTFIEVVDKFKEKKSLEDKLLSLKDEEKELENDVKKLEDPEYLARYAREKYFYSKDGELIIRIPDDK